MFFNILVCLLIQASPNYDSLLVTACQQQGLDTTAACAVFNTMQAAWLEVKNQKAPDGEYPAHSPFKPERLTVSSFEKKFGCTLPPSPITDSTIAITIAPTTTVNGDTSILCISFFTNSGEHLPEAILYYNPAADYLQYKYIMPGGKTFALEYSLHN